MACCAVLLVLLARFTPAPARLQLALEAGRQELHVAATSAGQQREQLSQQLLARASIFHRNAYAAGNGVEVASIAKAGIDWEQVVDPQDGGATRNRTVIWVTGFPRSGSSTLLSMVSVMRGSNSGNEAFALFEPCHEGDKVDPDLQRQGCKGLLRELSQCHFDRVQDLWGWKDPHSSGKHTPFEPSLASSMCMRSERFTFKTVDYGHDLNETLDLLESQPDLHIVAAVRDPRGIWASWKTLEPFATLVREGNFYTLEDICRSFAHNAKVSHPRIKRVLFERMVRRPKLVARGVYAFLGEKYGAAQRAWVKANFNSKECPTPPPWQVGFDDCREDSALIANQWRTVLTREDRLRFNRDANCRFVKKHYRLAD